LDAFEILRLPVFCADAIATLFAAWILACGAGHTRHGILEAVLAWLWSFVALVAAAGVILGEIGGFGPIGFLAVHGLTLVATILWRRKALRDDLSLGRVGVQRAADAWHEMGSIRLVAAALAAALMALTWIAVLAEPVVYDTLTYHLPRIGHWLQDGRIQIINTADARLNFVAVLPDIVAAWLLGPTTKGFPLVVLPQAVGGVMTVAATIGLARHTGLSRGGALLAGASLLGMANVVGQFTAAQTDLFTTGVFTAAFYLWVCALRRGQTPLLGSLGAGLALGANHATQSNAPGVR
jgi:hypothetical protein